MLLRTCVVVAMLAMAAAGPYRLPGNVRPDRYNVHLVPYLDNEGDKNFTFTGRVEIILRVTEALREMTIHSYQLEIDESKTQITEVPSTGNVINVLSHAYNTTYQFMYLTFEKPLVPDQYYQLYFEFTGVLNDEMAGFYRSSYRQDNEIKWMATTQFQATDARRAFPCFDEPQWKARFSINIARTQDLHVLGNQPLWFTSAPDSAIGDRVWDTFEETELMSTYLVAFIVSDFHGITYNHFIGVWARRNSIEQGILALQVAPKVLRALEDFTGIAYSWPKLDMVAIADFAAGAMENWGLVTYRETALLYDPIQSTENNRQRVATVVAHELAHMWFGNLVTLEWWSYTWLNEGFARYLQAVATDVAHPDWDLMHQFVVDHVQMIFRTDSLLTAQPLTNDCETPSEISLMFTAISYSKGGSILRMLDHTLTRDTFKKALNKYLNDNNHGSSTPAKLFKALDDQAAVDGVLPAGVTVAEFAENWTTLPGYPVVTITRSHEDMSKIQISQSHFLFNESATTDTLWWVPLTWTKASDLSSRAFTNTAAQDWLRGVQTQMFDIAVGHEEWIIFNNQQTGYYRVAYDPDFAWPLITKALQSADFEKIHVLNRAQIIDDALNLARGGVGSYDDALAATLYLRHEVAYIPWAAAFNSFSFLESRLNTHPDFSAFKAYVLESLDELYSQVTFFESLNEVQTSILNRMNALAWACKYGMKDCVDKASAEFKDLKDTGRMVSSNKKSVVYCTALRQGETSDWTFMWDKYVASDLATEQALILTALGCTSNADQLKQYLMMSITAGSGIRKQDSQSVFTAVYNNLAGVDIALDFLIDNFNVIPDYYLGMSALSNSITGIAGKLTTRAQVDKLITFIEDNQDSLDSSVAIAGRKAIEAAEADLQWIQKYDDTIMTWMKAKTSGAAMTTTSAILCAVLALFAFINNARV